MPGEQPQVQMNHNTGSLRRSRAAFTLLEAVVTLVVVSVLLGVTYTAMSAAQDRADDRALSAQLDSIRAAGRAVAAQHGQTFPDDVVDRMPLNGIDAANGPSTSTSEVSVWRINATRIAYAMVDGRGGCIGVWDDLSRVGATQVVWLRDYDTAEGNCMGLVVSAQDPNILEFVDGDRHHAFDDPYEIDFDAGYPEPPHSLTVSHTAPQTVELEWEVGGGPTTDQFTIERLTLDPATPDAEIPTEIAARDDEFVVIGQYTATGNDIPLTSHTDTISTVPGDNGFVPGSLAVYRVKARGRVLGWESPYSEPAIQYLAPPPPADVEPTPAPDSTTVTWAVGSQDPMPLVETYRVRIARTGGGAGSGTEVAVIAADSPLVYTHTETTPGIPWEPATTFRYAIQACNTRAATVYCSPAVWSDAESALEPPVPTAVPGLGYVLVQWPEVTREDGTPASSYTMTRTPATSQGTAGWASLTGDNLTVNTGTGTIAGSRSLRVTVRNSATAPANTSEVLFGTGVNAVPATAAGNYTAGAMVWTAQSGRTARIKIHWFNAHGAFIGEYQSAAVALTANTSKALMTGAVARPAGAVYMAPGIVYGSATHTGSDYYTIDSIGVTAPAGCNQCEIPGPAANFEAVAPATSNPTGSGPAVTTTSLPLWKSTGSAATLTYRTDLSRNHGALTATAAGTVKAMTAPAGVNGVPVDQRAQYTATAMMRVASGTGNGFLRVNYYNATGGFISSTQTAVTLNTTWSAKTVAAHTPPNGARTATVEVELTSAASGASLRFDDIKLTQSVANLLPDAVATFEVRGYADFGAVDAVQNNYEVRAVNSAAPPLPSMPGEASGMPNKIPNATKMLAPTRQLNGFTATWMPIKDPTITIGGWQVWYSTNNGTTWLNGCSAAATATTCNVTGLADWLDVIVVVVPTYQQALGPMSNSEAVQTIGKPAKPATPAAARRFKANFVSWAVPNDYGVPLTHYELRQNSSTTTTVGLTSVSWNAAYGTPNLSSVRGRGSAPYSSIEIKASSNGAGIRYGAGDASVLDIWDTREVVWSGYVYSPVANTLRVRVIPERNDLVTNITTSGYYKDVAVAANSWTAFSLTYTLPHGAYVAIVDAYFTPSINANTASGQLYYFDDLKMTLNGSDVLHASEMAVDRPSTVVTGLTNGTAYTYQVRACSAYTCSDWSTASSSATPTHRMSTPSGTTISTVSNGGSTTAQTISWSAGTTGGANGWPLYNLYSGSTLIAGPTTATSFARSGLTANTNYCYTIARVNGAGESAKSAQVCARTMAAAPSAPTASGIGYRKATISWGSVSSATGYTLCRWASSSCTNTSVSGTSTTVTGLSPCTSYSYRASATGPWGNNGASATTALSGTYTFKTLCGNAFYSNNPKRVASSLSINAGQTIAVNSSSWTSHTENAVAIGIYATHTASSYITVFPANSSNACGSAPSQSHVNYAANHWVYSTTTAAVSPGGVFCLYSPHGASTVHIDLFGVYTDSDAANGGKFTPLSVSRVVNGQPIAADSSVTRSDSRVPTNAQAWVQNATFVSSPAPGESGAGYRRGRFHECGQSNSTDTGRSASDGNARASSTPLRTTGGNSRDICTRVTGGAATLTVDSLGYYSASGQSWRPSRSRVANGITPNGSAILVSTGLSGATAITGNVAVVGATAGYVTIYQAGTSSCGGAPGTSSVNYHNGHSANNGFHVTLNANGQFCVRSPQNNTVYVDMTGYFKDT